MATYNDLFYDNFELPALTEDLQDEWSFSSALDRYALTVDSFSPRRSLRPLGSSVAMTNVVRRTLPTAGDYVVMGFRAHFPDIKYSTVGAWNRLGLSVSGAHRVAVVFPQSGSGGDVDVRLGGVAVGDIAFAVAGYLIEGPAYYEIEAYRDSANGFVGLYRDGVLMGSVTGDTSAIGGTMDRGYLTSVTNGITVANASRFTDFYIARLTNFGTTYSGNNLGPSQVHSAPVVAAVGTPDFTPSAGDNEDNLPIPHDTDTTYNESNTNDHEDRFTVDLSARPAGTIFAAGVELAVKQHAAGSTEIRSTMSVDSARTTGAKYLPLGVYSVRLSDITQSPGNLTDLDYIGYQNQAG